MQDVVLIGGFPASGKTTVANDYVTKGYVRLNRDTVGGSIDDLNRSLGTLLATGKNVVMDNLYATKISRAGAVQAAKKAGARVKFVLQNTSIDDAQFNACLRMMEKCGRILHPEDHKTNKDPNLFPIAVIYKYRKEQELVSVDEGFDEVISLKFERNYPSDWVNKAVIFDFDGTLRHSSGKEKYPTKPSEVAVIPGCGKKINEYASQGYLILGASNQSGIAKGTLTHQDAEACFHETEKQLGIKMHSIHYCPHKVPPLQCYCRKPNCGMGIQLIYHWKLNPQKCIYVGDMTTDKSFAKKCGFQFMDQNEFFR